MPGNKKQHYVPRFYLKRFSPNGKSINIWNIPNKLKIISANLKNQCYKDYFYGKEIEVEAALSEVENQTATVLRLIDTYNSPPPYASGEHLALILYVLMQHGRTAYSADTVDEITDKMMKHILGPKAESDGIDLSKVTIGIKNAAKYSLGVTTQCYPILLDLDCKLLINETDVEFVTSDNPAILYNQLFSFRKFGSNTGFSSKGLQIFFPISPKKLLLFYDFDSYSVGNRINPITKIYLPQDVFEINTLQMCSAYKNVYFRDKNINIDALHRKASPFKRQQKSNMRIFADNTTRNKREELIATSREDIKTGLSLSIIRITKSAKKWRNKFRKLKTQPATVVRNQKLCDDYNEFIKRVDNKEYNTKDFFNFIDHKYGQSFQTTCH